MTSVPMAPITLKQSWISATLTSSGDGSRHGIGGLHGAVGAGGAKHVAAGLADGVGGLAPSGDFDARGFRDAQAGKALLGGEDEGGVSIGDLGAVVGLERETVDDVAVDALDGSGLVQRDLDLAHLGARVEFGIGVFLDGDGGELALGDAVFGHVVAHDFGEDVGEDEDLAFALIGVGEVAENLADELAVHLAFGIAHFFVADGDAGFAEAELQLLNDRKDGLAAGGAGVLDGFDGFAFQAGSAGHESGEESLFIEGEVAGGGDGADVEGGGLDGDFAAGALDGIVEDRGHGQAHQFSKTRLVIGGDVDGLHTSIFASGTAVLAADLGDLKDGLAQFAMQADGEEDRDHAGDDRGGEVGGEVDQV